MAKIATDQLAPGMILSRPILNNNGLIILGENTELTDGLITRIRQMNIKSVHVKGVMKTLGPKEERLAELDRRFKNVAEMPYMDIVKRLLVEHIEKMYEEHRSENT